VNQLQAFALTLVLEVLTAFTVADLVGLPRGRRLATAVILASCLTHPIVWFVGEHVPAERWWPVMLGVEGSLPVVEGAVLWLGGLARFGRCVVVAGLMNGVSFGTGLLLWWWQG